MLARWGYHYVLEEWWFHVTLTRRLTAGGTRGGAARARRAIWATPRRAAPRDGVCLFTQAAPGAPFLMAERLPLRG